MFKISLSNDGRLMATGSWDRSIKIWSMFNYEILQTLKGHDDIVFCINFSKDSSKLISACADNLVKVWNVNTFICEKTFGKKLFTINIIY